MPETEPEFAGPPGGPRPPAPPATGEPGRQPPDPSDPGPPITVRLADRLIGDLGHPHVDARLVTAILLRDGKVAAWLRGRGVDLAAIEEAFPGSGW